MTREEAKKDIYLTEFNDMNVYTRVENLIDKIYYDFNSRTCDNCIHSYGNHPDTKACDMGLGWVSKDFSCSKFERKEL